MFFQTRGRTSWRRLLLNRSFIFCAAPDYVWPPQDNYNKKFQKLVADAMKDASADMAQYMCQKMADGGGSTLASLDTPLAPPYSISYDVGTGLTTADLMKGGSGLVNTSGDGAKGGESVNAGILDIGYSANGGSSADGGLVQLSKALFSRETRVCNICTTTSVKNCSSSGATKGLLGIGAKASSSDCKMSEPKENCRDVQM
ncbi:MAG: hypothetical protein LBL46_05170 [Rickettsiales bacterium]|jgi:hypothetical protein|nr:hypothetical protein [Rickettsiales bacterium]